MQSPIGQGGVDFVHAAFRVLTKSRKNEALIRNDGVYVISGIFCRANACKKVKARRAEGARTRPKGVRSAGTPRKRSAGAHGGRRQWRKQAVVSPMKQGEPQASLRAQWNDHAELRVGAKRKNAFPSRPLAVGGREAAGGARTRPKGVRNAGTPRRRRRGRCAAPEHRASVSAERCEDKRPGNPR